MSSIFKRKPVGSSQTELSSLNDQPWATAHLRRHSPSVPAKESTPKTSCKSDKTPTSTKGESVRHTNATMANEDTDAITPLPRRQVRIDPVTGHSNVTTPARPTRKHTYSELFDLKDLAPGSQIRSPSGQMLSAEQAAERTDRPKGIEERQEAIRRKVDEHRRELGNEVTVIGDAKGKQKREKEKKKQRKKRERERKAKWQKLKAKGKELVECHCQ